MKHNYLYKSLIAAAMILCVSSCQKGYFELYDNPSQVSKPSLPTLQTTVAHRAAINSYSVAATTAYYVQYLAGPAAGGATDTYQPLNMSTTWDALFYTMADTRDFIAIAREEQANHHEGIGNILLAYNLGLASDVWGDIPYTEAANADILRPRYDDQKAVYDTCMVLLDSAINQLSRSTTVNIQDKYDLIYGQNATAKSADRLRADWLKAAYSLKARFLLKASKTSSYSAAAVLQAVDNGFASNVDDMGMAVFQLRNNWATVANSNASNTLGGWLSEQLIDHLNGTTYGVFDPRISKITDMTVNGIYIGTVNGAGNRPPGNNVTKDECYISMNSPWTSPESPILLMTYAELKFIEAEAALAIDPNRAYNAYLEGIRANCEKLQVESDSITRYLSEPTVAVGAGNLTLDLIMKEKYVAMYLNPEAWNDARRYNYAYKDFTLPDNAELAEFIRRQQYPTTEFSENGQNVPVVTLTQRLWWDQ